MLISEKGGAKLLLRELNLIFIEIKPNNAAVGQDIISVDRVVERKRH